MNQARCFFTLAALLLTGCAAEPESSDRRANRTHATCSLACAAADRGAADSYALTYTEREGGTCHELVEDVAPIAFGDFAEDGCQYDDTTTECGCRLERRVSCSAGELQMDALATTTQEDESGDVLRGTIDLSYDVPGFDCTSTYDVTYFRRP